MIFPEILKPKSIYRFLVHSVPLNKGAIYEIYDPKIEKSTTKITSCCKVYSPLRWSLKHDPMTWIVSSDMTWKDSVVQGT